MVVVEDHRRLVYWLCWCDPHDRSWSGSEVMRRQSGFGGCKRWWFARWWHEARKDSAATLACNHQDGGFGWRQDHSCEVLYFKVERECGFSEQEDVAKVMNGNGTSSDIIQWLRLQSLSLWRFISSRQLDGASGASVSHIYLREGRVSMDA
jgi:hypothetical protein